MKRCIVIAAWAMASWGWNDRHGHGNPANGGGDRGLATTVSAQRQAGVDSWAQLPATMESALISPARTSNASSPRCACWLAKAM